MENKKSFDLKALQKKGQAGVNRSIDFLIGGLVVVLMAVQLAPEMFGGIAALEADADTPGWVSALLFVIVGVGIVFLIWRAFGR